VNNKTYNYSRMLLRAITDHPSATERRRRLLKACSMGVSEQYFDPFLSQVFEYLTESGLSIGHTMVPHYQRLLEAYPSLGELPEPIGDVQDIVVYVKERYVETAVDSLIQTWQMHRGKGAMGALEKLLENLQTLAVKQVGSGTVDFDASYVKDVFMEEIRTRRHHEGLMGLPYPWARFNTELGGMEPGHLIMIYSLPKKLKTWLALYIVTYLKMVGYRALVYSADMNSSRIFARIACMLADLKFGRYRKGQIPEDEEAKIEKTLLEAVYTDGAIRFTKALKLDGTRGGLVELEREAERYQPDIILLDSAYTMGRDRKSGKARHEQIGDFNEDTKALAEKLGIPIIAIYQENEKSAQKYGARGDGRASIADAGRLFRDVDVALRVVHVDWLNEISLYVTAARDCLLKGITIHALPGESFDYISDELHPFGVRPPGEEHQGTSYPHGKKNTQEYEPIFTDESPL
jgi:hypothetical protein